jgi:hypothetical protein
MMSFVLPGAVDVEEVVVVEDVDVDDVVTSSSSTERNA